MNITQRHLDYWRQRKINPRWADQIKRYPTWVGKAKLGVPERRISIDEIVNLNAGPMTRDTLSNTISLLKLARKNGDLLDCMARCCTGHSAKQYPRRAASCRKWLPRLGYGLPEMR